MTLHAIRRYRERVQPWATLAEVVGALTAIALGGRRRAYPRRWMRGTRAQPGATFVYAMSAPGVCLVMRKDVVLSVLSRASCAAWRRMHPSAAELPVARDGLSGAQRELVDLEGAA